jgi:hypothetical protein
MSPEEARYAAMRKLAKKKQDSSYDGWDVNKVFVPFSAMRRDFRQTARNIEHF